MLTFTPALISNAALLIAAPAAPASVLGNELFLSPFAPITAIAVASGSLGVALNLPTNPSQIGQQLDFQYVTFDGATLFLSNPVVEIIRP